MVVHRVGTVKANNNALIIILGKALVIILAMVKTRAEMRIKTKAKIAAKITISKLGHRKVLLANLCQKRRATKPCRKRLCLRQNLSHETQTTTQIIETPMAAMLTVAILIANIEAVAEVDKYLKY